MPMTPADFGKLIADETEKWGKVINRHQAGVIGYMLFARRTVL